MAAGVVIGATAVGFVLRLIAVRRPAEVRLTITRNAMPPREPEPTLDRSDPVAVRPIEPTEAPSATPVAVPVTTGDDPVLRHLLATASAESGLDAAESSMPGSSTRIAAAPDDSASDPARERIPVLAAASVRAVRMDPVATGGGAPSLRAVASAAGQDDGDVRAFLPVDGDERGASGDPGGAPDPADGGDGTASGPCSTERRLLGEVTAIVARARALHEDLAAQQRRLQREYDAAMARIDEATLAMDGRRVLEEKAEAQRRFREARLAARDPVAIEAAAARWLSTINQLNLRVRDAQHVAATERRRVTRLVAEIEAGSTRVDGARIALESAELRMRQAREALAACEELATARRSAAAMAPGAPVPPGGPTAATPAAPPTPSAPAAAPAPGVVPTGAPMAARFAVPGAGSSVGGGIDQGAADATVDLEELRLIPRAPLTVLGRILEGDDALLQGVAGELGGGSAEDARRWSVELAALRDALVATAIEAAAIELPGDHPFWSAFSGAEAREIAVALSSLGYRFDGRDGFADGRVPATRDLALAVGYAGIDPLRIRRWPAASELPALLRGTRVAGAEFVTARAPNLTLGEMIDLLGQRATELTTLWDAWGRIRPLLVRRAG